MKRSKLPVSLLLTSVLLLSSGAMLGLAGCRQNPPAPPPVDHHDAGRDRDRHAQPPPPPPPQDRRDPRYDQDHRNAPPPPPRQP